MHVTRQNQFELLTQVMEKVLASDIVAISNVILKIEWVVRGPNGKEDVYPNIEITMTPHLSEDETIGSKEASDASDNEIPHIHVICRKIVEIINRDFVEYLEGKPLSLDTNLRSDLGMDISILRKLFDAIEDEFFDTIEEEHSHLIPYSVFKEKTLTVLTLAYGVEKVLHRLAKNK
jgi:hypothetical protein